MSTVDADFVEPLDSGRGWPPEVSTMIAPDLARQELQDRKGRPVAEDDGLIELLWRHYTQAVALSAELSGDLVCWENKPGLDQLTRKITEHVKTHKGGTLGGEVK